ncbi:MAG: acyl-CoA dehydrogenase family protein [Rhodospirillales bacterium]|nr:acyl-CoA dehydrogenase family protein [Rhodospirillales bacterium]
MTSQSAIPNVDSPSYELSPDQREFRDQAEKYFMAELHPLQQRMDDEEWWPEDTFPKLGEMGYLGLTVPEEYGGAGLDYLTTGVICEAMSSANHAIAMSWAAHDNLCLNNIYRNGNEDQRRKYLPKLCSGEFAGALGMTEPGAGSDALGSMRTTARKDGNDYVLNGAKMFITNGPIADVLLVYAKTEPEKGVHGISAFIVEKDFPGFKVAQKLDKMGYRGSPTAELVFDDCRVPAENLVGGENRGNVVMMSGLDLERAMISPISIGVAARALDLALDYAKTREQFGKPIASFQMIQSKLATMYIQLESARTFAYRILSACNNLEHGEGGRGDIHKLTAAGVHYTAEASSHILDEAVQIFGGMGYMRESEVNRLYRAGKLMEIGGGTQEIRKIIISGEMLRE